MKQIAYRGGWIKFGLVVVLMAGGAAGGFYLSGIHTGGCHNPDHDPAVERPSDNPSPAFSHRFALTARDAKDAIEAPELALDASDRIWLTWASKTGDAERSVFVTRSADQGRSFASPIAVSKGGVFRSKSKGQRDGYERRATPHLAAIRGQIALSWSQADADGGRLRLMVAPSSDGELAFGQADPADRGEGANPCFTGMAAGPDGVLACVWLGGAAGQQPFAAIRPAGATAFEKERLVHAGQGGKGVCPCCPVAVCFAPDGTLYVAFRNIADGCRDIAIGVLKPGAAEFGAPVSVIAPTWKFDGCPHDGPALAIVGAQLHVVWMDAHTGSPRCYHASAKRSDLVFTAQELHPIATGTQGNAKLHVDPAGKLHAVWEESAAAPEPGDHAKHQHGPPTVVPGGGRAIFHAVMGGDGRFAGAHAIAPRAGAFQTRPAVAVTGAGRIVAVWNELDETGKAVVVTSLAMEGRP